MLLCLLHRRRLLLLGCGRVLVCGGRHEGRQELLLLALRQVAGLLVASARAVGLLVLVVVATAAVGATAVVAGAGEWICGQQAGCARRLASTRLVASGLAHGGGRGELAEEVLGSGEVEGGPKLLPEGRGGGSGRELLRVGHGGRGRGRGGHLLLVEMVVMRFEVLVVVLVELDGGAPLGRVAQVNGGLVVLAIAVKGICWDETVS